MRQFISKHLEETMVALAIVQLLAIALVYIWAINIVIVSINKITLISKQSLSETQFNLAAAGKIDLRGLTPQ